MVLKRLSLSLSLSLSGDFGFVLVLKRISWFVLIDRTHFSLSLKIF